MGVWMHSAHELFTGEKPWGNKVKNDNQLIGQLFSKEEFPISDKKNYGQ